MQIVQLIDEDFVNYKRTAMYIGFPTCTFKCDTDCGRKVCQNRALAKSPTIEVTAHELVHRYLNNPLTGAIVFAGLEPLDSMDDLKELIVEFRKETNDDIVIYTGYNQVEQPSLTIFDFIYNNNFPNIIFKYGRFMPDNKTPHYDDVLGVTLASDNQFGYRCGLSV